MRKEHKSKPNTTPLDLAKLLLEANERWIIEAYHRAVKYAHRIPGVGVRVHGHLGDDGRTSVTIKALDFAALPGAALKQGPMEWIAAKALLEGAPPGHFPCMIVEDPPGTIYPWEWFKIPGK
jgi:hypothetical protein